MTLESRARSRRGDGMSAMEAVAWLGGERLSQSPRCVSRVLAGFVESCNDRWPDAERQLLKPYVPLIVGTRSGPAVEHRRAYVLTDRAVRAWALFAAHSAGSLARQWGGAIRAQAEKLAAVELLGDSRSALRAAAVAFATADEIQAVADLVEFCALDDNTVAGAHADAHALAAEAVRSAAYAAQALAAGATYTAATAATAAVEATEATGLAAAYADGASAAPFTREETVAQSLNAVEALLAPVAWA